MGPLATHPASTSVDEFLRAFDAAWASGRPSELCPFLPPARHPLYLEVLRELVRIDLELGWRHGSPRPLEEYLRRYPELACDPASREQVAFEEYRQRRLAGQAPDTAEYEGRFGVSTTGWLRDRAASAGPLVEGAGPGPGADRGPMVARPNTPASGPAEELQALLRRRLALIGLACTLFFGYFAVLVLLNPSRIVGFSLGYACVSVTNWVALLTCAGLTLLLWRWGPVPVSRLRVVELALFGIVLGYLGWSFSCDLFVEHELSLPLAQGDHALFHYCSSWSLPFFALIVGYGVLVPSTFRRCALVVSVMALLPLCVAVAGGIAEGALTASFVQSFLLQMALWLAGAAGIAVYGSHRLESLRRDASAARQLGQYRLKRRLGAGGMGEVYLAEHVLLRRPCAVKVIRPDRAGDPAALLRFEREVQVLGTLRHPNTVQVYDYGHASDGTFYYAMEYLPGLNLEELVASQGPVSPERAVHLLLQVCGALRESHAAGLIHRDIKPTNIMTYEAGGLRDIVKLLDFGLVHVPIPPGTERLTGARELAGTPAYMSPEQAAGKETIDARTDIYSLGAVAYFLLTGQPPFLCETAVETLAAHLHRPVSPPDCLRPGLPVGLQAVVLSCLEKDPARRPPDISALAKALARCTYHGGPPGGGIAPEGPPAAPPGDG